MYILQSVNCLFPSLSCSPLPPKSDPHSNSAPASSSQNSLGPENPWMQASYFLLTGWIPPLSHHVQFPTMIILGLPSPDTPLLLPTVAAQGENSDSLRSHERPIESLTPHKGKGTKVPSSTSPYAAFACQPCHSPGPKRPAAHYLPVLHPLWKGEQQWSSAGHD